VFEQLYFQKEGAKFVTGDILRQFGSLYSEYF
jgi:hypothetical protein